ncbi:hypothetical protein NE237_028056 [Protea cynaroides]|uniref:TF-B3 domain-containing protein n=1 Tax=Protea cynaroides TaxID=273540 RepID=A0A9Q0GPN8_9MAGN|nr:hypothetical protein NE237_028056 [Protea cynaroides]
MVGSCWNCLEKRPHFFKVFLPGFSSEYLKIPIAFFKHLKDRASHVVSLMGPSGKTWQVRLVWNIDGWFFQDGWSVFVSDHSIEVGDVIVFRYDGESQFSLRIFDRSACEKKAAFSVICSQDTSFIVRDNGNKRGRDVVETCLQGVAKKKRMKSPQVCLQRTTWERAVTGETFYENSCEKKAVVSEKCSQDTCSARDATKHKQRKTVAKPFLLFPCAAKRNTRNPPVVYLENETKKTVVKVEDSDESSDDRKHKRCRTVAKPSSFLPSVTKNKRRDFSVIRFESETKKIVVKSEDSDESGEQSGSKRTEVLASKRHKESDFLGEGKKQGILQKKEGKGMHSSSNKASEVMPTWNGGENMKHYNKSLEKLLREFKVSGQCSLHLECSDIVPSGTVPVQSSFRRSLISQRQKITMEEVRKTFEAAHAFRPKNPSAVVVMKHRYVYAGFYLALPASFIKIFLPQENQEMILWGPNDKAWPVKYVYAEKPFLRGGLSAGWNRFVVGNNLELHDVCVFELVKAKEVRVHIFRVVEKVTPPIWG